MRRTRLLPLLAALVGLAAAACAGEPAAAPPATESPLTLTGDIAVARWGVRAGATEDRAINEAYVRNVRDWVARVAAKRALAYEAYAEPTDAPRAITDTYRALFGG